MKLNIIMPVYNLEQYVSETIESILNQNYKNYRLLIVDDGSEDYTLKICREFEEKNQNITVYSKENGGVSSARNLALEHLDDDCEYVGFVDGDDLVDWDFYELLIGNLEKTGSDVSCCEFGILKENEISRTYQDKEIQIFEGEETLRRYLIGYAYDGSLCNKVFRKNLVKDLRFDTEKVHNEDVYFGFLCQERSRRTCYQRISKYIVRNRMNSASRRPLDRKFFCIIDYNDIIEARIKEYFPQMLDAVFTYRYNSDIGLMRKISEEKSNFHEFDFEIKKIRMDMRRIYKIGRKNVGLGRKVEGLVIAYATKFYYPFYRVMFGGKSR